MAKYGVYQAPITKRWYVEKKGLTAFLFGNIVPEASNLGNKGFKTRKKAVDSMKKYIKKKK